MSATQILQILQQSPDLVVEIKSQVADRMQEQGMQVSANDISDEMLYTQISTNATLRTGVSTYLQARGYASPTNSSALGSTTNDVGPVTGQNLGGRSPLTLDGSVATDPASATNGTSRFPAPVALPANIRVRSNQNPERSPINASTDLPQTLHEPTPYNLQSMRDLYTQAVDQIIPLKRFGSEVYTSRDSTDLTRSNTTRDTPLDVPLGPDYIVGPGDGLTISMWGGVTQSLSRTIDRDGRILLPEAGSFQLAGLPLRKVEEILTAALTKQFRNIQISITVSHLRSVRVYIVGDVQRPGGYDISSLATPLSALSAAGGPTSAGSLRIVRHYRGTHLLEDVDLYDFLIHGLRVNNIRFEAGDTLLVPPSGPQIAIRGAIKRPAIYELGLGGVTLASLIEDAGGLTAAASAQHIIVDRIDDDHQRETVALKADDLKTFQLKDGDRIRIGSILTYSQRAVYLEGHVVRAGRLPYSDGMRLSDILRSYQDMLPEPAAHGQIIRLIPPDLHAESIDFNVPDILAGNANLTLQPYDTIRVVGRYELDAPRVTIQGEVLRPSTYPLSTGMTASQLVRMAGGFKRDALLDSADLTTYSIVDGNRTAGSLATVPIGAAVAGTDPAADILLKPGDILTIHQITGWNDIGESVTIDGQVRFPGTYGFREGERLSSVLLRAGGLRDTSYPEGAVLVRQQVRDVEEKSRQELIRQIETNAASARLAPNLGSGDSASTLQMIKAQQEEVLAQLKSHQPTGRLVVHISADIKNWANTPADIELRRDDVLAIPKRPAFVLVTGQVYNSTALTFAPGKTAGWYLSHAGGTNTTANRKEIFIIRANGSVIGRNSGGAFSPSVLATKLDPGDVVVVPQKVIGSSLLWRNLLTAAQLASSIAITAAVASL